jgi:hypothetical protein
MKRTTIFLLLTLFFVNVFSQIPCLVIEKGVQFPNGYRIVNYNANVASFPIIGLDPNLEVLVKRTPFAIPDYDPRLVLLQVIQQPSLENEFDEQYPTQRMWVTTYSLVERDAADKAISVDESENDANYQVFPTKKQLKYMVLAIAIVDRKASGLTISTKQQQILDSLQAKAAKIWNNHIVGEAKKAELIQGVEVDLDSDWENEE